MNFRITWNCRGCRRSSVWSAVPGIIPFREMLRCVVDLHDENNSQCSHKHIILTTNPIEVPHVA